MSVVRTILALAAITLLAATQGCDRNITVTDEGGGGSTAQNCFECHSDQDTYLIAAEQQWQNSFHASGLNIDRGSRDSCSGCHISEGFVQRANGEEVTGEVNPTVIHCFTCHEPHTRTDFSLRWTAVAELEDGTTFDLNTGNTCVACHHARRDVNSYVGSGSDEVRITSTHWGPHHSNQGDMLLGSNGYEYSGYNYDITPHRSATRSGCIDCHFKATSNNIVGGHSFNMRGSARDEGGEFADLLNTAACEPCHGDLDDFNYNGAQDDVDALIAELDEILEATGLWHEGHPVSGNTTTADSAGAVWNLLMAEEDRSHGVHNYKYTVALLESAIEFYRGSSSGSATQTIAGNGVSSSR